MANWKRRALLAEARIERMRRSGRALRTRLRARIAVLEWLPKQPCLMCSITTIDPMDTPFITRLPKVSSKHVYHEWIMDKLVPAVPENFIGWWWRVVYAKFLALARRFH